MHGRVTATISKFSTQVFETYFRMIKVPPKSAVEFTQLLQLNDPDVKGRSHDLILRIGRFLVSSIGSRCSDGPISRFRFCDENVGKSFVVCSHDPIFRTDKESSIWRQSDHRDIMQICRRLSSFKKSVGWKVIFNVFTRSDFRNPQKSDP